MSDDDAMGFTLDQRTEMSRAFDAGNYANAYETTDLEETDVEDMEPHERAAFVLGFFGSYTLDEIDSEHREAFDEAYASPAGRYVVEVAKYTDDRADEYKAEDESFEPSTCIHPGCDESAARDSRCAAHMPDEG